MIKAHSSPSFRPRSILAAIVALLAAGATLDTGKALAQEGVQILTPAMDEAGGSSKPEWLFSPVAASGGCKASSSMSRA